MRLVKQQAEEDRLPIYQGACPLDQPEHDAVAPIAPRRLFHPFGDVLLALSNERGQARDLVLALLHTRDEVLE